MLWIERFRALSFNLINELFFKMKKLFKVTVLLAIIAIAFSCNSNNKKKDKLLIQDVDPRMDMSMQRTKQDTERVLNMAKQYLDLLKENNIEAALNQLVEFKNNSVKPLSSKRRSELKNTIEAFPVHSYKIDEVLLYSDSDTDVRYTITFFEKAKNDNRPNTIKCAVHPKRIRGTWYLTVAESSVENNFRKD